MKINCPNCNNQLDNTSYCSYCNRELMMVDNYVLDKKSYLEIKEVHSNIDNLINEYDFMTEETRNNMNNPDFFAVLNADASRKDNVLQTINNVYRQLTDVKLTFSNYYNDYNQLQYLKSMDEILGSVEPKILNFLNCSENMLLLLNDYRNMILNNNALPDVDKVAMIHNTLDDYRVSFDDVYNELNGIFSNSDSLSQLRYDRLTRSNIKDQIISALDTCQSKREELNTNLDNENFMIYASYYDNKFGNIRDKMLNTLNKIDLSEEGLNKMLIYLDSIDEPAGTVQNNQKTNARRLDL